MKLTRERLQMVVDDKFPMGRLMSFIHPGDEANIMAKELCELALRALDSARTEVERRQVPPEIYDGMAVYVELGMEKTETIRPQMVSDVLDALMRLIRKRWREESAPSPPLEKP